MMHLHQNEVTKLPHPEPGNGNTGGSSPAAATYASGANVTVSDAGTLVKTGYTFNGWNTAPDGSGTDYTPTATITLTAPTILYAQWTVNIYRLYLPLVIRN